MNRVVIAPIVAVLSMIAQLIFHVQIPDDVQAQLVTGLINIAAIVYTIYGLIKKERQSVPAADEEKPPYQLGYVPSKPDHRDLMFAAVVGVDPNLPRKVMNDPVPIVNQGNEGACTGFAGAYHKGIQERPSHGGQFIPFSQRFLYKLARTLDGLPDDQEGSTPKAIMQVMQKYGVCLAKTLPYYPQVDSPITEAALKEALDYRIKNYAKVNNVEEIKTVIAQGKTVVAGVMVTDSFMYPEKGGFVGIPQGKLWGGHGIELDGYDDDMTHTYSNGQTLTGFVRFPNSWGEGWGDKGYGYIPYKFFELQSDLGFYYFMEGWTSVDLDSDPVPAPAPQYQTEIQMWVSNPTAIVNGQNVPLEQPPVILNDHSMSPIRFVAETLGATVNWSDTDRKITIRK